MIDLAGACPLRKRSWQASMRAGRSQAHGAWVSLVGGGFDQRAMHLDQNVKQRSSSPEGYDLSELRARALSLLFGTTKRQ